MDSDKAKRIALLIGALVVIALVLLLRRGSNTVIQSQSGLENYPVAAPVGAMNFGPRPTFEIPDFGNFGSWRGLTAIGACCTDCAGGSRRGSYMNENRGGTTIVFNEAARGPNVYNHVQQVVAPAPTYNPIIWSASR